MVLVTPPGPAHSGYLKGAELAVSEVNAHEGKQGLQILLVLRSGDLRQRRFLEDVREAMLDRRVLVLLGKVPKESIIPLGGLAREKRIPFLVFPDEYLNAPSTGAEPENVFWVSPSPEAFQRAAVRLAGEFSQKRFYFLGRDSTGFRAWVKYFWDELKRIKPDAQPAGEILLFGEVANYGPYIQGILSARAEVCFSHLGAREWPHFARMARQLGYFKKIVHFELEIGSLESLQSAKKDVPEGVWGASAFPFWGLDSKETRNFVAKYRQRTNLYPDVEALGGYVSIQAVVEAMKKSGSVVPEKFMETMERLTFPTPVGPLGFRQADHRALWPIWGGSTKFVGEYPFPVLGDLKPFGPDSFSPGKTERNVAK